MAFPGSAIIELVPRHAIRPVLVLLSPRRGAGHAEAVPEPWALGVASPGTTGSFFLAGLSCRAAAVTSVQCKSGAGVRQRPCLQVPKSEDNLCRSPPTPGAPILPGGEPSPAPGSVTLALRLLEHTQGRFICRQLVGQCRGEKRELLFCVFCLF